MKFSRPSKYRSEKTSFAGLKFDSKKEAARWGELLILERLGQIERLERQVAYELAPSVKFEGEKRAKPALRYVADFRYRVVATGQTVVEDVKSPVTASLPAFRIKQHLMKSVHGLEVKVSHG